MLSNAMRRAFGQRAPPTGQIATPKGKAPHIDWSLLVDLYLEEHGNSVETQEDHREGILSPSMNLIDDERIFHCYRQLVFQLMCAPKSATQIPATTQRVLDGGHRRHARLDALFEKIVAKQFMGVVKYERGSDIRLSHSGLPLDGTIDGRITMANGHVYVFDYKTAGQASSDAMREVMGASPLKSRPAPPSELAKASDKLFGYRVQLNTYLGMLGDETGYLIIEDNNTRRWVTGPDANEYLRIDFDQTMFARTEGYVRTFVEWVRAEQIPVLDEERCKANLTFCRYRESCQQQLDGASFRDLDRRSDNVRKRHLEVVL